MGIPKGYKYSEEVKRKRSKRMKKTWLDSEYRGKRTKSFKGRVQSEKAREKIRKTLTGRKLSEEHKIKLSMTSKRAWQNGVFDGVFQSPTKPEKEIMKILKSMKLDYIFQFRPKGYSRIYDFYIPGINLLIEYDGSYWHRNTQERDAEKTSYAKNNNYKLLRVNEETLKMM